MEEQIWKETLLLSATYPKNIQQIAQTMTKTLVVFVDNKKTADFIASNLCQKWIHPLLLNSGSLLTGSTVTMALSGTCMLLSWCIIPCQYVLVSCLDGHIRNTVITIIYYPPAERAQTCVRLIMLPTTLRVNLQMERRTEGLHIPSKENPIGSLILLLQMLAA